MNALKERLLTMGGLAEERVRSGVASLSSRDPALIVEILGG